MKNDELPKTTLEYVLWSLLPYSQMNLKLAFKPHLFFNDLEKISRRRKQSIRNVYYKAIKSGLIEYGSDKMPRLTEKGRSKLQRYQPKKLAGGQLMVVFDIPEKQRTKRQRLRTVLREFKFQQIQKSVWVSQYDCEQYLRMEIQQSRLEEYAVIYEARRLQS